MERQFRPIQAIEVHKRRLENPSRTERRGVGFGSSVDDWNRPGFHLEHPRFLFDIDVLDGEFNVNFTAITLFITHTGRQDRPFPYRRLDIIKIIQDNRFPLLETYHHLSEEFRVRAGVPMRDALGNIGPEYHMPIF